MSWSATSPDFDLRTFIDHMRATKPPYRCPYPECNGKVYKSFSGIQTHFNKQHPKEFDKTNNPKKIQIFDGSANSPTNGQPIAEEGVGPPGNIDCPSTPPPIRGVGQSLSWSNMQKVVDVDYEGRIWRLNILEPLEIVPVRDSELPAEEKWDKVLKNYRESIPLSPNSKPPEAKFRKIEGYKPPSSFPMPASYIRHIEKSQEELDQEVEYDMDDEDSAWLKVMNDRRALVNLQPVPESTFEFLLDRLEKESHFQSTQAGASGAPKGANLPQIDEDAVCCVCQDGECQNTNVILFCDMCNLAVHQECYGVPYIPEGQWLCRRCQLSPSMAVDCCLCPNKGGAFKQTADGRWAHVICAIWVPEVHFANTVFLEPVEGMGNVPPARWKLKCIVCKQRGLGACIQCHKPSCYTAFHVTCAQSAGLYMRVEPASRPELSPNGNPYTVRKSIYCDLHAPGEVENWTENAEKNGNGNHNGKLKTPGEEQAGKSLQERKQMSEQKIRKARRLLAQRRNSAPNVSIPVIPKARLDSITSQVKMAGKQAFVPRLVAYWTLKRESRFGVPLLRRLQVFHEKRSSAENPVVDSQGSASLRNQLKLWRQLRQDLEKVRLLCELCRKRERLKLEYSQIVSELAERLLKPPTATLTEAVVRIMMKDRFRVFTQPVTEEEVRGYHKVIKNPMDLSTMLRKTERGSYKSVGDMQKDFKLMIDNCISFNGKTGEAGRFYWKYAMRMKRLGYQVLKATKSISESGGDSSNWASRQKILKHLQIPLVSESLESAPLSADRDGLKSPTPVDESKSPAQGSGVGRNLFNSPSSSGPPLEKVENETETEEKEDLKVSATESTPAGRLAAGKTSGKKKGVKPGPKVKSETKKKSEGPLLKSASKTASGIVRRRRHMPTGFPLPPKKRKKQTDDGETEDSSSVVSEEPVSGVKKKLQKPAGKKEDKRGSLVQSSMKKFLVSPEEISEVAMLEVAIEESPKSPEKNKKQTAKKKGRLGSPAKKEKEQEIVAEETCKSPGGVNSSRSPRNKASFQEFRSTEPSSPPSADSDSAAESGWISEDTEDFDLPILTSAAAARGIAVHVHTHPPSPPPVLPLEESSGVGGPGPSFSGLRSGKKRNRDGGGNTPRFSESVILSDDASSRDSADLSSRSSGGGFGEGGVLAGIDPVPLDQVWGRPAGKKLWVPALVIDRKMPPTGYLNCGVPIQGPRQEILDSDPRKLGTEKPDDPTFLLHFFDAADKWEWVPRSKISQFGLDSQLDKNRLKEAKKAADKSLVKAAYDKAVIYRCRVTGEEPPEELRERFELEMQGEADDTDEYDDEDRSDND